MEHRLIELLSVYLGVAAVVVRNLMAGATAWTTKRKLRDCAIALAASAFAIKRAAIDGEENLEARSH